MEKTAVASSRRGSGQDASERFLAWLSRHAPRETSLSSKKGFRNVRGLDRSLLNVNRNVCNLIRAQQKLSQVT